LGRQVCREVSQEALDALALHLFEAHPIDARRSLVGSHLYPSPPQDVGPDDAVIQGVEPPGPTPLGRQVQSALEGS
jgi:hypothetical protein